MTLRAVHYGGNRFSVDDDQRTRAGWDRSFVVWQDSEGWHIDGVRGYVKLDGRLGRQVMKAVNTTIEKERT